MYRIYTNVGWVYLPEDDFCKLQAYYLRTEDTMMCPHTDESGTFYAKSARGGPLDGMD